ncbi:hypothetical protein E0L36_20710 [Streptomyces sp. AJS327]|uniref:hypothetical protein n=1 Tax=Streptomyces sp. AJS327 TaxID=2545265 RepID=UPI0015DE599E|nr:hypothetical protein [Streptomyces sp. AJS327]MBA0053206.1 hypothetical protein [Streptomyces sp. AJS327]
MVLPDSVAPAASAANHRLGSLYALVKRLDEGTVREGEDLSTGWEGLDDLWYPLWRMRRVMRIDLGITTPEPEE